MERKPIIRLKVIAERIESELNQIYNDIYSDIDYEFYFKVYIKYKDYYNTHDTITVNDTNHVLNTKSVIIVPVILDMLDGNIDPNQVHSMYNAFYVLQFRAIKDLYNDLYEIFNKWVLNKTGLTEYIDDWRVINNFQGLPELTTPDLYDGDDVIYGNVKFFHNCVLFGVMSNDVTIIIDNDEIPILDFNFSKNKEITSKYNKPKPELSSIIDTSGYSFSINFILIEDSPSSVQIARDIINKEIFLKKKYNIEIDIKNGLIKEYLKCYMVEGNYSGISDKFLLISATFVEAM